MKIKEFIEEFVLCTKNNIEQYEKIENFSGKDKKIRLDEIITNFANSTIDKIKMNFVIKMIFKKILIENIPYITQVIFDLIKIKIEGITK